MAEQEQSGGAAVRIVPPLVPVAVIAAGLGLDYLWPIGTGVAPAAALRHGLGGGIVVVAILALGLWPLRMFHRTGQRPEPWKPTPEIIVRGPYRLTRNPMYLMMVLICAGIAVMLWNVWMLLLTPVCAWVLQRFAILPEEAYLEARFGDGYRAYKARVRRWI